VRTFGDLVGEGRAGREGQRQADQMQMFIVVSPP
jgi:hypothetical protein